MIFLLLLILISCGKPTFDIVKIDVSGANISKVKNVAAFVLKEKHGFQLISEDDKKIKAVKEIKHLSINKEDAKTVIHSKLLFLTLLIDNETLYIKSFIKLENIKLNSGSNKEDFKDRNIDKSSVSISNVKIGKKEGTYLSEILSDFANFMEKKYRYYEVKEDNLDDEIKEHFEL